MMAQVYSALVYKRRSARSAGRPSSRDILHVNDLLKLRQKLLMILGKVSNYTGVAEKFR